MTRLRPPATNLEIFVLRCSGNPKKASHLELGPDHPIPIINSSLAPDHLPHGGLGVLPIV